MHSRELLMGYTVDSTGRTLSFFMLLERNAFVERNAWICISDVCQPLVIDNGIVCRPNPSL